MPFDDSTRDTRSIYEITLSYILTIINKYKSINIPIFIIGDFNADLNRKNPYDKILSQFICDHDLIAMDMLNTQKNNYTFKTKLKNNNLSFSRLDHFLVLNNETIGSFKNLLCNIDDDLGNTSDHRAITRRYQF